MSWITIGNIVILNILIWLGLSLFWSHWTHKLFKPWIWLEARKRKQLNKSIEDIERHTSDKIRFYSHWFALEQIDNNGIEGNVVVVGVEEPEYARLAALHSSERQVVVVDNFVTHDVEVVRENCQGEKSIDKVHIEKPAPTVFDGLSNVMIADEVGKIDGPIALASIDTVNYDELRLCLKTIYPLLAAGGLLIVHDYNHDWEAVREAVDEFEASVPENFVGLPDMYGSVILSKSKEDPSVITG